MNEANYQEPNQEVDTSDSEEQMQTLSLLGGVAGGEFGEDDGFGAEEGSSRSKWLGQSTLLMVVVGLVAVGSLYLMRVSQPDLTEEGADQQQVEAQIEQALAKLARPEAMSEDDVLNRRNLNDLFQDTDSVVSMFMADLTDQQVPVDYVKKNPFTFSFPTMSEETDSGPSAEELREERMVELEREIDQLELQTVMRGRVPMAVIGGEFFQEGDRIGSFAVERINTEQLTVLLMSAEEGESFTLRMQDEEEDAGRI